MKLNLNDNVIVTLTEVGKEVYRNHFKEKYAPDTYKDQLWSIMEIFGPYISIGFNVPFIEMEYGESTNKPGEINAKTRSNPKKSKTQ